MIHLEKPAAGEASVLWQLTVRSPFTSACITTVTMEPQQRILDLKLGLEEPADTPAQYQELLNELSSRVLQDHESLVEAGLVGNASLLLARKSVDEPTLL